MGKAGMEKTRISRDPFTELPAPGSERESIALTAWSGALVGATLLLGVLSLALLLRSHDVEARGGSATPQADTDGDGIPDGIERLLQTSSQLADTDGDGIPDGVEVALGMSPIVPDEPPELLTGIRVQVLPSRFRHVTLLVTATSPNGFRDVQDAGVFILRDIAAPDLDDPEELDPLLRHVAQDATRRFLRAGERTCSRDGTVASLIVRDLSYDAIPRRVGLAAGFTESLSGDTVRHTSSTYFGRRGAFYRIAFETRGDGQVIGSHIFHVATGLDEDIVILDENEDCKQYLTPVVTTPDLPPQIFVITTEQCEERDGFFCPSDCGSDEGRIILKL